MIKQISAAGTLPTHNGDKQYTCRSIVSYKDATIRSDDSKEEVLSVETRSDSIRSRCFPATVAKDKRVFNLPQKLILRVI